jgi:hypothetical protein
VGENQVNRAAVVLTASQAESPAERWLAERLGRVEGPAASDRERLKPEQARLPEHRKAQRSFLGAFLLDWQTEEGSAGSTPANEVQGDLTSIRQWSGIQDLDSAVLAVVDKICLLFA